MQKKTPRLNIDPSPVIDLLLMPYATHALFSAVIEIDLFSKLDNNPSTFSEIKRMTNLQERPLRILLRAFLIFNLIKLKDDKYYLTVLSEAFLVNGKPFYMGESIAGLTQYPVTYEKFVSSVRTGKPNIYDIQDIFDAHKKDSKKALMFTKAMHTKSLMTGSAVVEMLDFSRFNQIVDIGGGSGGIVLTIANHFPNIRAAVFDLPQICNIAQNYISIAEMESRVSTIPGDMFEDDFKDKFPMDTDVVIFSRILHDWPENKCKLLLKKAIDILPPKGNILVIESLLSENQPQRVTPYLENLSMLLWTQGEQFTENEIENLLSGAGFINIHNIPILSNYNIIIAAKP